MLNVLLWLLAGLALFILTVICTPVRLGLRFNTTVVPVAQFKISLLGGLLPTPVSALTPEKTKAQKKKKKKAERKDSRVSILAAIRATPSLLSRLIARVKFEMIHVTIGFGFDNPADTGMLYGMLTPLERTMGSGRTMRIVLHPDFDRARLDGKGQVAVRFTPITLLPPVISFGWTVFLKPKMPRVLR